MAATTVGAAALVRLDSVYRGQHRSCRAGRLQRRHLCGTLLCNSLVSQNRCHSAANPRQAGCTICHPPEAAALPPCNRRRCTGCLRRAARDEHCAGEHPRAPPPVRPGKCEEATLWAFAPCSTCSAKLGVFRYLLCLLHPIPRLALGKQADRLARQLTAPAQHHLLLQMEDALFPILVDWTSWHVR